MNAIEMTIVMPSYNRGEYIEEAIKSVLMQKVSFKYLLIIADDASTDNSLEIANKYRDEYPDMVEVLPSQINQGLFLNCIRIYENMKTKYFSIVDADDYWVDDRFLQKAYDFLESNMEYSIYGSNTNILRNGVFLDTLYHTDCEDEMTVMSVEELYNGKMKYVTNTLETVFRNVIFSDGVPVLLKDVVGTSSEASFRGDTGRYMMHLKYGYAKFVNEVVCVYRQNDKGIWVSATDFHKALIQSRAQIDYCQFYDGCNKKNFYSSSFYYLKKAISLLFKMILGGDIQKAVTEDMDNLCSIIQILMEFQEEEYNYDNRLLELMKNEEHRKIIVWGTGPSSKYLIEKYLQDKEITYFVDGYEDKQGKYIDNIKVLSPDELKELKESNKYVIIASAYYNEIIEDILQQELCKEDEIINLYKMDFTYSLLFE